MTDHPLSRQVRDYLRAAAAQGRTAIVCGPQGHGASTLLASLTGEQRFDQGAGEAGLDE